MGLDAITVQLLGRWGSDAVLSDLSEAPLTNLGDRLREPMAGKKLQAVDLSSFQALRNPKDALVDAEAMCAEHISNREALKEMDKRLMAMGRELDSTKDALQGLTNVVSDRSPLEVWTVVNDSSKVSHSATINLNSSPATWSTRCGWNFAGKIHASTFRASESNLIPADCKSCPKCHRPADELSKSSSDSSSSND